MKLVSKSGGIAATSFIADEIKPLGGYHLPTLLAAIAERYQFARVPTLDETNKSGAKFQNGTLAHKAVNITELSFFNDSIHVTTTDTDDSDAVISDLYLWLIEQFSFREPSVKPKRAYQSDLIVDFSNSPNSSIKLFKPLMDLIQKEVVAINGDKREIEFFRVDFGSDPMVSGANAQFIVERRAGVTWKENRFFCKAYMQTEMHLKALTLMDKLLSKAKR